METIFRTVLPFDHSEETLDVAVSYEMRDIGVMGHRNERVRPFIREVLVEVTPGESPVDILYRLDDDQLIELEEQASRHEAGLIDLEESYRSSR